jgi:ribonucleotide reductase beta subunit family protein with ferritin-like domain
LGAATILAAPTTGSIPMTSSSTSSFQAIIESVETLSEEQDLLFELIHKRRIAKRRQEIAQNAVKTLAAVDAGTAKRGSVAIDPSIQKS